MSESDKILIQFLRDAETLFRVTADELEGKTKPITPPATPTPAQAVDYNIELIKWEDRPDNGKGPWQITRDTENPNYQGLLKALIAGGGNTRTKTHYVWQMDYGIGRKLWMYCKKK
jgi:hypothetical protein